MDIHEITLKRQIDFNNQWPKIKSLELESVEKFGQKLSDCKLEQLLVPMHWDEDKTFALFDRNHSLAKIFSSTLDMYEVLPFLISIKHFFGLQQLKPITKVVLRIIFNSFH